MKNPMNYLYNLLTDLSKISSTKEKVEFMRNNDSEYFRVFLNLTLNNLLVFNIKKLPVVESTKKTNFKKIVDFLTSLSTQTGTTKKQAEKLASMCHTEEVRYVVKCIIEKDMHCGINIKLVNKAFGEGTILAHSPMLCYYAARWNRKYKNFSSDLATFINKCDGWKNGVYASTKENGVRIWADIGGRYVSRNGINFPNFSVFSDDIKSVISEISKKYNFPEDKIIIDGEIISADEDFQKQMTQIRRLKEADPSIFRLRIFGFIGPNVTHHEKNKFFKKLILKKGLVSEITTFLIDELIFSEKELKTKFLGIIRSGGEGVVLKNPDGLYELKRSQNWCKVKPFFSADLKVVGFEISNKGKNKGKLKNLIVEYNGVKTKVGSGYSDEERVKFINKRPKLIEVEYFTITKDGKLFHPTFQRVRSDKNTTSIK